MSAMDAMSYAYKTQLSWGRLVVLDYKLMGMLFHDNLDLLQYMIIDEVVFFEVLDYHVPFNVLDWVQVPKLKPYIGSVACAWLEI